MTRDDLRSIIDNPAARRSASAVELAEAFLRRIEDEQPRLHALITITDELALSDARKADDARAVGEPLPLDGMPIVVKDVADIAGYRTTVGSRQFADRFADTDAVAVARLRAAGAVILGKANLHEVAFGGTSRNEAFGFVANPWDEAIIPGGSSGGSGAAVAADLCIAAIGSDTGGSVRLPASFCGVAGIRPTCGSVSATGVFPVSWTLDTLGPLARRVEDVAALLATTAGFDPSDPRSLDGRFEPPMASIEPTVAGLRIGLPRRFFFDDVDEQVAEAVGDAVTTLEGLGAKLVDTDLPGGEEAASTCGPLIWAEAKAVHRERLAQSPELFEEGTRARLGLADALTTDDLVLIYQRMFEWQAAVSRVFETVDLLLTPTTPIPPPSSADAETIATTAQIVPFTFAFALARVPALSVPCGFTTAGHSVGLQLVAPRWRDTVALSAAAAYQAATDFHLRRPLD